MYFPVVKLRSNDSAWFQRYGRISGGENLGWNLHVAIPPATSPCTYGGRYHLKVHIPSFPTSTHIDRCTIREPGEKNQRKKIANFPNFPRENRKNGKTQKKLLVMHTNKF
jgi:hypothetical protein